MSQAREPDPVPEEQRAQLVACARRVLGDRDEAEDVVQELYLRTRTKAPREKQSFLPWLFASCYRLAVDHRRARARRDRVHGRVARPEGTAEEPGAESLDRAARLEHVRAVLDELDEPYRSAIRLRYLEDLPFDEVARRLGTIERTARTWVGRGLGLVRERLALRGGSP